MPITIIGNAGDRPKTSNGALGRAKPNPHRFELLKPMLIRMISAAASKTPTMSMPTSGLPRPGFNQKLSARTTADNTIRMPNAGRQPMKVPSTPLIRNAATPTPARAEFLHCVGLNKAPVQRKLSVATFGEPALYSLSQECAVLKQHGTKGHCHVNHSSAVRIGTAGLPAAHYINLHAVLLQPAGEPEAVASGLVGDNHTVHLSSTARIRVRS